MNCTYTCCCGCSISVPTEIWAAVTEFKAEHKDCLTLMRRTWG